VGILTSVRRRVIDGKQVECSHIDQIKDVTPSSQRCEECIKLGDTWVHLRLCMICGNVACCDDSKNTHATKHYHSTGHPIIRSFEPDESWLYCYPDNLIVGKVDL